MSSAGRRRRGVAGRVRPVGCGRGNGGAACGVRAGHTAWVTWVGPGGWRIDQITITREGVTRTLLRVRRHGYFIAEVGSVADLAALGVDLATLVDEDAPDEPPD